MYLVFRAKWLVKLPECSRVFLMAFVDYLEGDKASGCSRFTVYFCQLSLILWWSKL